MLLVSYTKLFLFYYTYHFYKLPARKILGFFIRLNQVYFSSTNFSTDAAVSIKDKMFNEKFTFCFKITIKWNETKSDATRLKTTRYKTHVIKKHLLK